MSQVVNKHIVLFLILTALITYSLFALFLFMDSESIASRIIWVVAVCGPGIAALLVARIYRLRIRAFGWKWGKSKYHLIAICIPLLYGLITYVIVWMTGLGAYNKEFSIDLSLPFLLVIIRLLFQAFGEEIGWQGFLVPNLIKKFSFAQVAIINGLFWAVWHYPATIFHDYNQGASVWYSLIMFTIMVIGISFPHTWVRLKSGNLWTATFMHASHNIFIQEILSPLTKDTGNTRYIIGEFGAGLAIMSIIVGIIFWRFGKTLVVEK